MREYVKIKYWVKILTAFWVLLHITSCFTHRTFYNAKHKYPDEIISTIESAYLDGENNVVELSLQKETARVQINTKAGEVKEYEVQEAEVQEGFFTAKRKVLLFVSSIMAVAAVLKLMNIF